MGKRVKRGRGARSTPPSRCSANAGACSSSATSSSETAAISESSRPLRRGNILADRLKRLVAVGLGPGGRPVGLVALGGVEDQFAEEFAGGGVDDADVELLDQDEDMGCGVGSSDADGVELSLEARVDLACLVDAV